MKKYPIKREFFPWNLFAPPISEKFLAMSVPHMKPPKSLWRDKELDVTTHDITTYDGETITCFVMSPKKLSGKVPCLVYLHGGGFVLEAAGYHYGNAMRYAKEVGCKVVFPLYRLAPQHPFPDFFEDCYAAFTWAYDHAEKLGIDTPRIGIGGDSAGSTLAVGVCLMARQRNHPVKFRFQMLPYPFLDARNESESCKRFTDTPMWNSSLSDRIGKWEYSGMYLATALVTLGFYFILEHFNTANIIPSTLSVTTSFIAVYLTFRRSPYFALAYAANDVVLILLWTLAAKEDISYLSVIICFVMFLVNDLYGFVSWKRMEKRQRATA